MTDLYCSVEDLAFFARSHWISSKTEYSKWPRHSKSNTSEAVAESIHSSIKYWDKDSQSETDRPSSFGKYRLEAAETWKATCQWRYLRCCGFGANFSSPQFSLHNYFCKCLECPSLAIVSKFGRRLHLFCCFCRAQMDRLLTGPRRDHEHYSQKYNNDECYEARNWSWALW